MATGMPRAMVLNLSISIPIAAPLGIVIDSFLLRQSAFLMLVA